MKLSRNADELSPVESKYRLNAAMLGCAMASLESLESRGLAVTFSRDPDCGILNGVYDSIVESLTQEIADLLPGSSFSDTLEHRYKLIIDSLHPGRLAIAETNEANFHLTVDGFGDYVLRCGDRIRRAVESYRLLVMNKQANALTGYISYWPKDSSGELVRDPFADLNGNRAVEWGDWFNNQTEPLNHVMYSADCLFPGMRYAVAHPELFFTRQSEHWSRSPSGNG